MFKIYNPYLKLFFGGMNVDGHGGHSWSLQGREFSSVRGAMVSLRSALHRVPADFEIHEFDGAGTCLSTKHLDRVTKKNLVHPDDVELYRYYVTDAIRVMALNAPILVDGVLIVGPQ